MKRWIRAMRGQSPAHNPGFIRLRAQCALAVCPGCGLAALPVRCMHRTLPGPPAAAGHMPVPGVLCLVGSPYPVVDPFEVDRAFLHVGDQGREDQVAIRIQRKVVFLARTFLSSGDHHKD